MMRCIDFTVPGEARGLGRPRATVIAGHVSMYESTEDRSFKGVIQTHAMAAMRKAGRDRPIKPDGTGFFVEIHTGKRVLQSFSKGKRADALEGRILPQTKPDLDNIAKIFLDALNGILWDDDRSVTGLTVTKSYAESDETRVRVLWIEKEERK